MDKEKRTEELVKVREEAVKRREELKRQVEEEVQERLREAEEEDEAKIKAAEEKRRLMKGRMRSTSQKPKEAHQQKHLRVTFC